MRNARRVAAVLAALVLICRVGYAQSLGVGSLAPPLPPLEYLKGEPVRGFEPGRVYVVEFWATWCPPCRLSIPHLTELQRRYPAVRMIGVSAWDRSRDDVTRFVQGMGAKMAYTVAFDAERATDRLYMKPAGQNGIPYAFIVGTDGRLAWLGHPMAMSGPLARAVAAAQGGGSARGRMRFLSPPGGRVSGTVTLRVSADPVPRNASVATAVRVDGAEAATLETVPGDFVWDASRAAPGRHKVELLRRNATTGREFVTDTVYLTVGGGASQSGAALGAPPGGGHFSRSRREVWERTNTERARFGLAPLSENRILSEVAQGYAEGMARSGRFSHQSADGTMPWDRARRAGYRASFCGENIALGQRSAAQAMNSWMHSPGHRRNILNPAYTEIGIGHAHGRAGTPYWVQLFGAEEQRP